MSDNISLGEFGGCNYYIIDGDDLESVCIARRGPTAIQKTYKVYPYYFYVSEIDKPFYPSLKDPILRLEWETYGAYYKEAFCKFKKLILFK